MFNVIDGSLTIDKYGISINGKFSYKDFSSSKIFSEALPLIMNPPYRSYKIKDFILFLDEPFNIDIYFNDNRLENIHLNLCSSCSESSNWEDWSEETEKEILKIQNSLLLKNLGSPPYNYKWGRIESLYDRRSGETGLIITYI